MIFHQTIFIIVTSLFCTQLSYASSDNIEQKTHAKEITNTNEADIKKHNTTKRELEVNEDPLTTLLTDKALSQKLYSIEFYSDIYTRYRKITASASGLRSGSGWQDNGSRVGVNGYYQVASKSWLFTRYEIGFNLLDELKVNSYNKTQDSNNTYLFNGESLYSRLAYMGFESQGNIIAYGKNWSSYYQVASFTDRFDSLGGEASGAYNAGTDGGASGTGKADNVLQSRLNLDIFPKSSNIKPLSVNVQMQYGEDIPHLHNNQYAMSYGISTIIEPWKDFSFGIAYNQSNIDFDIAHHNAPLRHFKGDMSALLIGGRWFNEDWYIGFTLSKSENLHTTDNQQYFNGTGSEFYAQYQFSNKLWLLTGYNQVIPDEHQVQARHYKLKYGVLGLRYSIDGFTRIFYLENRFDRGITFDNKKLGNQYVVGFRWRF